METWAPVFDGVYEVSTLARVRRVAPGKSTWVNRVLRYDTSTGYARVCIHINGKRRLVLVHQLVARAFVPGLEEGKIVNHIDGNPLNNSIKNLEWVTNKENTVHAWRLGMCRPNQGDAHGQHKLKSDEVRSIRSRVLCGASYASLAREFNVTPEAVSYAARGITWKHI